MQSSENQMWLLPKPELQLYFSHQIGQLLNFQQLGVHTVSRTYSNKTEKTAISEYLSNKTMNKQNNESRIGKWLKI